MASNSTVSVCIPTYNQAAFLASAIESALNQRDVDVEVLIADDCSSDSTATILDRFANDPRIQVFRSGKNQGIANNASYAIRQAQSDYVVRLDSDDVLQPTFCKALSEALDANPQAAVGHCAVEQIDGTGLKRRTRRLARKSGFQSSESALLDSLYGYKVAANICMFRMKVLAELPVIYQPGFDFGEDWELYVRLADLGWGNVYLSSVLAEYRVWREQNTLNVSRKKAEILGIDHILSNSIADAWARRGWSCTSINASRRRFASVHLQCLANLNTQSVEYIDLRKALVTLAGNDDEFIDNEYERLCLGKGKSIPSPKLVLLLRDLAKSLIYR